MMCCRNESWVLGCSARVALTWCDALVVLDHSSTDETSDILTELKELYGNRICWLRSGDTEWREMEHRQTMLNAARAIEATHLAIIDADEVLTANSWADVRRAVQTMRSHQLIELPGYNLRGSLDRYHLTGIWGDRWFASIFMDDPRLGWSGDRFHHRAPMGMTMSMFRPIRQGHGGVLHLWGADERRLKAKHALYKMTETLRWPSKPHSEINRLYSLAFDPSLDRRFDQIWRYAEVPYAWWAHKEHVRMDVEPWQEAECKSLWKHHGAERFSGLDLFGVCEGA